VGIKRLDVARLVSTITTAVVVSIDVAKAAFVAVIRTTVEEMIRIVRFEHPSETRQFLDLVKALQVRAGQVTVLMEPTGTYGDAIRYQLGLLGVEVRMVQPKRTHDAREVFDGVPSKHDQKDAVTMSMLHEAGASRKWQSPDEQRRALRAMFDQYGVHDGRCESLYNQIEARLAKHWPEFEEWLSVRQHRSGRALLEEFVTPQRVAQDPEQARRVLVRASRSQLSPELIAGVIGSAQDTLGVPMIADEEVLVRDLLVQVRHENAACEQIEERIGRAVEGCGPVNRLRGLMGLTAAAAIWIYLGSPADYPCVRAFLKAAGLNMRESSSGTAQGGIHITKRGPGIVRKLLYLTALRTITNDPIARSWYQARGAFRSERKAAAVVALMRKLLAGAYHMGRHDVPYDAAKLFDTRRLMLAPAAGHAARPARPAKRTAPRSIARSTRRSRGATTGGANA
jgi:transposase